MKQFQEPNERVTPLKGSIMKRMDYARPARNVSCPLYRPPGTARAENVMFGALGLVGLAAVFVALTWGTTPDTPHTSSLAGYFNSGQAEADLRTADAMVQYLMESDPPLLTNSMDRKALKNAPTNSASAKPNA